MNRRAAAEDHGMSPATAKGIERAIIALCVLALVFVFQPFSHPLSSVGMALVVVGGLAFNLVPLCEPGRPLRQVLRAALIVLLVLAVAVVLAIASAYLYGVYLTSG